jgi:ribokinase
MGRVLVAGSINVDLVTSVPTLPVPGQTVLGSELAYHPGGKGANHGSRARRPAKWGKIACIHAKSSALRGGDRRRSESHSEGGGVRPVYAETGSGGCSTSGCEASVNSRNSPVTRKASCSPMSTAWSPTRSI